MKALSLDLRQRITTALQAGHKRGDIAARFAVSESSVYRLQRQFKTTQDLAPKRRPGRGHALPDAQLPALEALLQEQRDPTGESLRAAWQERTGKRLGLSTMHRALHRLARSFKKSAASPRKSPRKGTRPSAMPSAKR
jgi:transposase